MSGAIPITRAVLLVPAQLLASMCAGGLVQVMLPGDISAANTKLAPGVSTTSLVFMVYMLAQEKSRDTFIAPIGIGLALFSAILPGTQPITPSLSFSTPIASP